MTKKKDIENEEENLEEEDLEEENLEEENDSEEEKDLQDKEEVEEKIDESKEALEEVNTRLMRLQADFVNYKKRVEKEKDGLVNYGMETIICELLPVLDNCERAMKNESDKESGFYDGIKMIQEQLIEVLEKNGVKEIEALHEPFDHEYHHAVVTEDSDDWEEGIILGILQKGYIFNDKVIRPSMVRVAK